MQNLCVREETIKMFSSKDVIEEYFEWREDRKQKILRERGHKPIAIRESEQNTRVGDVKMDLEFMCTKQDECANKFCIAGGKVCKFLKAVPKKKLKKGRWSKKEEEFLLKNMDRPNYELAKILGRTEASIARKKDRLKRKIKVMSEEEDEGYLWEMRKEELKMEREMLKDF